MIYTLDTEFLEGTQKTFFGKSKPTIDLISIGLVSEDGREYYAISKDFNLKEAWNRYDLKPDIDNGGMKKVYWIRENVLKPIYYEWYGKDIKYHELGHFTYFNFNRLLKKYGKTNKQIAEEVVNFVNGEQVKYDGISSMHLTRLSSEAMENIRIGHLKPEFYGYYCDYDWVVFCWLFGKMIDLPKGFPMYCRDLKQILDDKINSGCKAIVRSTSDGFSERKYFIGDQYGTTFDKMLKHIKDVKGYPKQDNAHNALDDAKWNMELYKFLKQL